MQSKATAGITPAYAGKSSSLPQNGQGFRDHPRLCGEKRPACTLIQRHRGSPPPMRGKEVQRWTKSTGKRITPAYAGKSVRSQVLPDAVRDHPRLCGEKLLVQGFPPYRLGSPPPMRGKDHLHICLRTRTRITPAYAGKSYVHGAECRPLKGSPPPMRGKDHTATCTRVLHRITPAYAGKRDFAFCDRHSGKDHPRLCGEKAFPICSGCLTRGSPPPMRGKATHTTIC